MFNARVLAFLLLKVVKVFASVFFVHFAHIAEDENEEAGLFKEANKSHFTGHRDKPKYFRWSVMSTSVRELLTSMNNRYLQIRTRKGSLFVV